MLRFEQKSLDESEFGVPFFVLLYLCFGLKGNIYAMDENEKWQAITNCIIQ